MSARSDSLVLFGVTGDLAYKKLFPALANLVAKDLLDGPIIGVASSDWTTERLRSRAEQSIRAHGRFDAAQFEKLASRLSYVRGNYYKPELFDRLCDVLADAQRPLF